MASRISKHVRRFGIGALGLVLTAAASLTFALGAQPGVDTVAKSEMGTAFTYQGYLTDDAGSPRTGVCSFTFDLYDELGVGEPPEGGSLVGSVTVGEKQVEDGYFTVELDFGASAFSGEARYLQVTVDCGDAPATLSPRQAISPTPYSLHAASIADGAVTAASIGEPCGEGQVLAQRGEAWSCADAQLDTTPRQLVDHLVVLGGVEHPAMWADLLALQASTDYTEYRDGADPPGFYHKVPGRNHFEDLQLICLESCPGLNEWYHAIRWNLDFSTTSISVIVFNGGGAEVQRWNFAECWPRMLTTAVSDDGQDLFTRYSMTCFSMDLALP